MRLQSISRLVLHESMGGIASRNTSNVLLFQLHYAVHNMNRKPSGLFLTVTAERRTVVITHDYTRIASITNPTPQLKITELSGSLQKPLLPERRPEKTCRKNPNGEKLGRKSG